MSDDFKSYFDSPEVKMQMLLAELEGIYLGLMLHPSDYPTNGCLISEASKEKLGTIKELINRYKPPTKATHEE